MKYLLILLLISTSSFLYSQSGLMYFKGDIQGQFRFTIRNDTMWILEDYVYTEDNKKRRFTHYWGERITARAKCGCVYYTEYSKFSFTLENNQFITCLYEPILGATWYYHK